MSELPSPVRKALDTVNAADSEAFTALFARSGSVRDWSTEFCGAEAIRRWSDAHFIGKHAKLNILTHYLTDDGEAVVIAHVTSDEFNGPATYTFGIDGDLLRNMHILA